MSRLRAFAGVATVVALPMVAIRLLHGLADRPWFHIDWSDLPSWLATTSFTDAVSALARLAALVVAYWSVAGTLAYLTAVFTGSERLMNRVAPFTFPVVRRLADRLVAGTIAIGVMTAPLVAATDPPVPAPPPAEPVATAYVPATRLVGAPTVDDAAAAPEDREDGPSEPPAFAERPVTRPDDLDHASQHRALEAADRAPMVATEGAMTTGPIDVVAAPGDHLWMLAERRLVAASGRAVLDHEIAPYWRATVEVNLPRLRSGDADLIQPGETITLPDPADFIPEGS
jgi:nucleoid-associated protein YgaU